MQKWQEKQRQKAHQLKVEKAKSAIRRYSNSRERAPNSGRIKNSSPKQKQTSATPIGKILQIFQLQKYGALLSSYGFPQKLTNKKSLDYIDQMMKQVAEKDKQKFLSLLNTLTIMSKDLQRQSKTPKSSSKPNKVYYPPPPSSSGQQRQPPNSVQKSEKASIKFRVKQKNTITALIANKKNESRNAQLNSRQSQKTRQNSQSTEKRRKKSISHYQSKATDDLSLIYDFPIGNNESGLLRPVQQSNKIINKLLQKLELLEPSTSIKQNSEDLNLQMQKIKHMYLSFDSATLTSNIINIDMHQMIECLAMQVKQLITRGEISNLAKSNADKIKSLLHQSFILAKQESKESRNLNEGEYLPEKMDNSIEQLEGLDKKESNQDDENQSIKKFQEMRQIDVYDDLNQHIEEMCDTDRSSDQQPQSKCSIDLNKGMKESSIWGNSYIASVINDFSCFDNIFQGTIYMQPPQQEDLKNFIQLVVMAGRMQKQVPIIAYIYLKRLLNSSMVKDGKVSHKNWRNLMLVTLIEASKIWDDQSLQNHSFARLIKPYTTLEINRLEKYLLFFLDYRLTIDQKQYSQAYFELRKHIGEKKSTQSANLMKLDLRTIKKLQQSGIYGTGSGNSKKNIIQKKEHFKRLLNKSF